MADSDDLIKELSQDISFLRASPEDQRAYLQFKDPNFPKDAGQQEAYRQRMHNQAVTTRNAEPGQFEKQARGEPYYGFTPRNIAKNVGALAEGAYGMGKEILFPEGRTERERMGDIYQKLVKGPAEEEMRKAGQTEGIESLGHRAAAELPFFGPNVAAPLGEQIGRRDIGGAAAQVGAAYLGGKLMPRINAAEVGRRMIPGQGGAEPLLRPSPTVQRLGAAARDWWRGGPSTVTGEDLRPLPTPGGGGGAGATLPPAGPREGPRAPTADEALNARSQAKFGKDYDELKPEQKRVVARDLGVPGQEQRVLTGTSPTGMERRAEGMPLPTIAPEAPVERRAPGGQPMGAPPGGVERRRPTQAELDWDESLRRSAVTGQPMGGETLAEAVRQGGERIPPEMEGRVVQRLMQTGRWDQFKALDSRGQSGMAREVRDEILREQRQPGTQGPLPGTTQAPGGPGGAGGGVPPAPAPSTLTPTPEGRPAGQNVPQGTAPTLDEILRRATGQPEPQKPKPGVPLREQPGGKE